MRGSLIGSVLWTGVRCVASSGTLRHLEHVNYACASRVAGSAERALAARFGIRTSTVSYPMAQADTALQDLAHGRYSGSAVLHNQGRP